MSDWHTFVQWELASRETIDFKMIYVDIAGGDILAGLLLSQIIFWNLPNKDGRSKLRVQKEDKLWLARKHSDWYQEIRMSEDQVRRALGVLKELNLVEVSAFRFNGERITHIALNKNVLAHAVRKAMQAGLNPLGNGINPTSERDITHLETGLNPLPLTETTTEITTEISNTPLTPQSGETCETKQISLLPVLVEPKTVTQTTKKPDTIPAGFDEFYQNYPSKIAKQKAIKAWKALKPSQDLQDTILKDVAIRKQNDRRWLQGFIPNPATYLNEKRWEDDVQSAQAQPPKHMSKHERNQAVLDEYFAKKGIKTNGLT